MYVLSHFNKLVIFIYIVLLLFSKEWAQLKKLFLRITKN